MKWPAILAGIYGCSGALRAPISYNGRMDADDAASALEGAALVPLVQGAIPYIKELVQKCLDAGVPALAGCPPGAKSS